MSLTPGQAPTIRATPHWVAASIVANGVECISNSCLLATQIYQQPRPQVQPRYDCVVLDEFVSRVVSPAG
jgi:hypothetical protein